jgi:DNA-binding protein H-NS
MTDIDLERYSNEELHELLSLINTELETRETQKKKEAVEKVKAIAESIGLSPRELIGMVKSEEKSGRASGGRYKYQNPARPRQKWSGKGTKPEWFVTLEQEGRTDEARIASS